MTWLWWAPLGAAALHIFEEFVFPGGFAAWDRAYRPGIRSSITPRLHVQVNSLLLLGCLAVALSSSRGPVRAAWSPAQGAVAWLALAALLFSNAVFHALGAIRTRRYSPGMATGLLLYVPMAVFGYVYFLTRGRVPAWAAALAALAGGSYHAWMSVVHSWRARHARTAQEG
jgi:hypothetical protein